MYIALEVRSDGMVHVHKVDAPYTEMNLLVASLVIRACQNALRRMDDPNPSYDLREAFGVDDSATPDP